MIKAIIIRLGELGRPFVGYDAVDYSIRNLFSRMKINRYIRSDRELKYLQGIENKIKNTILELTKED